YVAALYTPMHHMKRTPDYYHMLGFSPYRWALFVDVPWPPLRTPLDRARVTLITTAAPFQPGAGDQGPGAAYNAAAKFYQVYSMPTEIVPDLRISHVGYDRLHTSAADPNAYLPLAQLQQAAAAGRIGSLGPRLHGAPTNRSHRATPAPDLPQTRRRRRQPQAGANGPLPS